VLIIEAMAQAGGILAYLTGSVEQQNRLIYFMGMDKVRFRRPVVPGDQIIFEAKILKFRSKVAKMTGTATVDSQLAAEAELMASFGENK
jgi:3-hydroxymyristoyl/3-hydroxydecanoyl-(acyl carrier protein) dehydratase